MNGFSAMCKQTSGFAPDYLTAEQTTSNRNWYRLNRVLDSVLFSTLLFGKLIDHPKLLFAVDHCIYWQFSVLKYCRHKTLMHTTTSYWKILQKINAFQDVCKLINVGGAKTDSEMKKKMRKLSVCIKCYNSIIYPKSLHLKLQWKMTDWFKIFHKREEDI